jgi:hypothetical protein
MKYIKTKSIPKDAIWLSRFEFEQLGKMTYEDFTKMDYGSCALKFTAGGGRDICRLIWEIIHKKN